jgi:hypothetical protein
VRVLISSKDGETEQLMIILESRKKAPSLNLVKKRKNSTAEDNLKGPRGAAEGRVFLAKTV